MQELNTRLLTLGASGMRGVVGTGLTPGAASDFASAFATFAGEGAVLVGSDPRTSSAMLKSAVSAALAGGGCEVVDGGILTAGLMHRLIPAGGYSGGILITGGHQAAGMNALIPLAADGSYFDHLRQRELFDLYLGKRFITVPAARVRPARMLDAAELEEYWAFLERNLDLAAIRAAKLTLLADFCNGAGAAYAKRFASLLGVKLIALNDTPCGTILEKSRVGQAWVVDLARSTGAALAGEGSGGFTTSALRGFDGFLMAGLLLEAIAVRGPLGCQLEKLPRYEMVKQTIPSNSPHAYTMLRQMMHEFGDEAAVSETDGLRFDWPDGFLSLRLSSTEPILRLISESKSRELASDRAWKARLAWERL